MLLNYITWSLSPWPQEIIVRSYSKQYSIDCNSDQMSTCSSWIPATYQVPQCLMMITLPLDIIATMILWSRVFRVTSVVWSTVYVCLSWYVVYITTTTIIIDSFYIKYHICSMCNSSNGVTVLYSGGIWNVSPPFEHTSFSKFL